MLITFWFNFFSCCGELLCAWMHMRAYVHVLSSRVFLSAITLGCSSMCWTCQCQNVQPKNIYIIAGRIHKHLLPTFTDQSLRSLVTVKRKCHQITNNNGDEKIKWNLQRRASINEFKLPYTGSNGMAVNLKLEAAKVFRLSQLNDGKKGRLL